MSSPGERNCNPFESPENKDGPPLYHSTDNFLPLGFSTPQHRNNNTSAQMYSRNYYSAQPKHMLPRQRGFQNRNRGHQQQQQQQHQYGGSPSSPGGDEGSGGSGPPPERRPHFNNRNWKGGFRQNHQQHGQFQRRNRFGLGHQQNKDCGSYNINDYFHPSMLEDPWMQLVQNSSERAKGDSSDNEPAGGGGGSSGLDED